jgi:transposase
VEGNAIAALPVGAVLLGLDGFRVLAAGIVGGEVELLVESVADVAWCPGCGVVATAHGRREHLVRDVPVGGRPVAVMWAKRVWRCDEPACARRTWSETTTAIRARASLTGRAAAWVTDQVGRLGRTVAAVRRDIGVGGWATIMRAVRVVGQPLVDDPARLAGVRALGVDESAFTRATATRATRFVTGIVDTTRGRPARLLDIVDGRTSAGLTGWLAGRDPAWRAGVVTASLDPYRGYATALTHGLPAATRVLDAFHTTRLALSCVDEVRRRVQQEQLGHRGHRDDPLFAARRVLRRRADRLTDRARGRLQAALAAADPDGEVWAAWLVAQQVMGIYAAPDPNLGRRRATDTIATALDCPVPEVTRLGRTLHTWRRELLAYFDTGGVSNGPVEAVNLLIEKTRRAAHGFRNLDNYRLRLLLNHGGIWNTAPEPRIRTRRPRFVA